MPMPAASKAIELTTSHADADGEREGVELGDERVIGGNLKGILLAGRHLADEAQQAAHLLDAGVVAGAVAGLDEDGEAAPDVAEAVEAGGEGDDGEVVLVAAQGAAFGLEHAHDGVIQAVYLHPLADG